MQTLNLFAPRLRVPSYTAGLALLALLFAGTQTLLCQEEPHHESLHFSAASLRGDYGVVATYGANIARALGTQTFDGDGDLKGSALINQPGPNNTRTITHLSFTGTYTVNQDGTGSMILKLQLANGQTAQVTEDFVITKAVIDDGVTTAMEITDAQEQPSAAIDGGVFVTHTYTRRTH